MCQSGIYHPGRAAEGISSEDVHLPTHRHKWHLAHSWIREDTEAGFEGDTRKQKRSFFPFRKNKSGSGLESSFSFLNSGLGQQRSLYKKDHRGVSHSKSCCELQAYLVSKVENLLLSEMFVTETMNYDYLTFNHYRNRK